jgi:hypothetical protein
MGSSQQVSIAPGGMFFTAEAHKLMGVWQFPGPLTPAPSSEEERDRVRYDLVDFHPDRSEFVLGNAAPDGIVMNWPNPISIRGNLRELLGVAGAESVVPAETPIGPPLYPATTCPTYSRDGRLLAATRSETKRHGTWQTTLVGVWEARTGRSVMALRRLAARADVHTRWQAARGGDS